MKLLFACAAACVLSFPFGTAVAQDQPAEESYPFEGGTLTITETPDYEKVLAYDGQELARNYYVSYDGTVEVSGVKVALASVGDGGNMCAPVPLLIWKPEGEELRTLNVGEPCDSPPAAVASDGIYFVPFLVPGGSGVVRVWTPQSGVEIAGNITYTPQPGTRWNDLDPSALGHILDAMKNADIYAASQKLLGDRLTDVVTSLMVGSGPEETPSGAFYARGCVPHNCGGNDGFMAIDPKKKKLYFARQDDNQRTEAWPPLKSWPKDLRETMQESLKG